MFHFKTTDPRTSDHFMEDTFFRSSLVTTFENFVLFHNRSFRSISFTQNKVNVLNLIDYVDIRPLLQETMEKYIRVQDVASTFADG